ncbi:hypothetical protein Y032_0123g1163 [Ancylostoma ceylanicum]|uniref:Uncharacterized protein n=1 Tax=Ancylostoma ceylanicum TaxID=53326 RepID=A0A016T9M8_9BILA|nr:hypothetical protein Y032_0123g1163 [Ancylostoma ceylanicum]
MASAGRGQNARKALEQRPRPLGPLGTETLDIENRTQNWTAERRISVLIRVWQRNVRKNVTDDLNSLEHVKWPSVFVLESPYQPAIDSFRDRQRDRDDVRRLWDCVSLVEQGNA